jgi:hypothetical protein
MLGLGERIVVLVKNIGNTRTQQFTIDQMTPEVGRGQIYGAGKKDG